MNEFIDVIQQLLAMIPEPFITIGLVVSSMFGLFVPFAIAASLGYVVSPETMVLVLAGLLVLVALLWAYEYAAAKRQRGRQRTALS